MNYCDACEYYDECEYSDGINFCDNCKDCSGCNLRHVYCKAGHEIECNNGFEPTGDCYEDDEKGGGCDD